ncbi:MAG: hypothetical protein RL190_1237 [Actinomycetota bacterium]|jgi:predicted small metal-binding protein
MAKQWSCNEDRCGEVVTADSIEELIELVNGHMRAAHDSYELEEMIEDAAIDVDA